MQVSSPSNVSPSSRRSGARTDLPRLVVVGMGRAGGSIASAYADAGGDVCAVAHSRASRETARRRGVRLATGPTLLGAELCLLAVPDAKVGAVAAWLAARLGARTTIAHCAGALTLDALGTRASLGSRPRASFHPLCSLAGAAESLEGSAVALSASSAAAMRQLRRVARALKMKPLEVPESERALYHAGAVLGSGALGALAATALEAFVAAGVPLDQAKDGLFSLMRSALRNAETYGFPRGLTGPVVRGDVGTVRQHLAALPRALLPVYATLMLRSLDEVSAQLPPATVRTVRRMLRGAAVRGSR